MSQWKPMETVPVTSVTGPTVMLYSRKNNIRWPDCFFAEGEWVSRIRFVDDQGRRVLQFHGPIEPECWHEFPDLPKAALTDNT